MTTFQPALPARIVRWGDVRIPAIRWAWLLQRAPLLFIAIENSFYVYTYILEVYKVPAVVAAIGGVTFDLVIIGMIALSDFVRNADNKKLTVSMYYGINILCTLAMILFSMLAHSPNNKFSGVSIELALTAIALPLVGLAYSSYYERVISNANEKRIAFERANAYMSYCGNGFEAALRRNNHEHRCSLCKAIKARGDVGARKG
jgi:hypothetical protein